MSLLAVAMESTRRIARSSSKEKPHRERRPGRALENVDASNFAALDLHHASDERALQVGMKAARADPRAIVADRWSEGVECRGALLPSK